MTTINLDDNQRRVHTKMREGSWLSSESHAQQFYLWNTYYRRNMHRFAMDYFGFKLHFYQIIILWAMSWSNFIVVIASRAAAKSYIIAIYACCKAVLYPGSRIVLTSATRGQSQLIVSEKIKKELCDASPNLRREIVKIKDNDADVFVKFKCGSSIHTVTLSKNSRGNRSTVNVGEEAREIDIEIYNEVVNPFLIVRQAPFMMLPDYNGDLQFQENPCEIFISSSIEESHWLYGLAKTAMTGMIKDDGHFFIAFDYSITLKHGIRTRKQLIDAKSKSDPITWMVEYENLVLRTNSRAYFTYELLKENQTLVRAFYPRKHEDVVNRSKNKFAIPKQPGELRVISCDIAAIDRSGNDNSSFACLRLFEETVYTLDGRPEKEFRVQVPYIEAIRGQETKKQAIRIRQLYSDFDADYIVLDLRNLGVSIYDSLARVLYDDERGVEYKPFKCMNDDTIANRIVSPSAEPNIFAITASMRLNSEIAINFKSMLMEHRVDLLVDKNSGLAEMGKFITGYDDMSAEEQLFYERPYLETMLAVNEMINLVYEKMQATGLIRISEVGQNTKDRYTSVSYGCYFVSQLARDLLNNTDEYDFEHAPSCVSAVCY